MLTCVDNTSQRVWDRKRPKKLRRAVSLPVRRLAEVRLRKLRERARYVVMARQRRDSGNASRVRMRRLLSGESIYRRYVCFVAVINSVGD